MTKKAKISFLIVVWSIVAIQMYVNYEQRIRLREEAVTAFSVEQDKAQEETIHGYGKFGDMELTDANKKKMLINFADKLGITDGYTFRNGTGDHFTKKMLVKKGKYATVELQLISLDQDGAEPEQYIVTNITTRQEMEPAILLYRKVKRIYEEIGVEAQVSIEVAMKQAGNVASTGKESVPEQIFALVKAKKVDEITENNICTVYGYTWLEKDYLKLNNKKVNIQIVMSYDEKEDETYIKIGVPLVNTSY